jgi:hypothetical protein
LFDSDALFLFFKLIEVVVQDFVNFKCVGAHKEVFAHGCDTFKKPERVFRPPIYRMRTSARHRPINWPMYIFHGTWTLSPPETGRLFHGKANSRNITTHGFWLFIQKEHNV